MKLQEENISYFINLDKFPIHEPQNSKYQRQITNQNQIYGRLK